MKCPFETPINPDTAFFVSINNRHGRTLTLSHKCASCMSRYRWRTFLAGSGMAWNLAKSIAYTEPVFVHHGKTCDTAKSMQRWARVRMICWSFPLSRKKSWLEWTDNGRLTRFSTKCYNVLPILKMGRCPWRALYVWT
jgi:hypothetical protein